MRYKFPELGRNFGDCINEWLWPRVLAEAPSTVNFYGIGTLLCAHFEARARSGLPTHVMGSGAGIGAPPSAAARRNWRFHWVRGPLTCDRLGLPEDAAITDPAALVGDHLPAALSRAGTLLVLHHSTQSRAGPFWREAAAAADVGYVDPMDEPEAVMTRIAGAELVIADAMHAAIVADAVRTPWVPMVACAPLARQFKWLDYAASMDVPYKPHVMPAADVAQALGRYRDATRPGPLSPELVGGAPSGAMTTLYRGGALAAIGAGRLGLGAWGRADPRRLARAVAFLEGLRGVSPVLASDAMLARRKQQLYEAIARTPFGLRTPATSPT